MSRAPKRRLAENAAIIDTSLPEFQVRATARIIDGQLYRHGSDFGLLTSPNEPGIGVLAVEGATDGAVGLIMAMTPAAMIAIGESMIAAGRELEDEATGIAKALLAKLGGAGS